MRTAFWTLWNWKQEDDGLESQGRQLLVGEDLELLWEEVA